MLFLMRSERYLYDNVLVILTYKIEHMVVHIGIVIIRNALSPIGRITALLWISIYFIILCFIMIKTAEQKF